MYLSRSEALRGVNNVTYTHQCRCCQYAARDDPELDGPDFVSSNPQIPFLYLDMTNLTQFQHSLRTLLMHRNLIILVALFGDAVI
jgi:hypothetical protein